MRGLTRVDLDTLRSVSFVTLVAFAGCSGREDALGDDARLGMRACLGSARIDQATGVSITLIVLLASAIDAFERIVASGKRAAASVDGRRTGDVARNGQAVCSMIGSVEDVPYGARVLAHSRRTGRCNDGWVVESGKTHAIAVSASLRIVEQVVANASCRLTNLRTGGCAATGSVVNSVSDALLFRGAGRKTPAAMEQIVGDTAINMDRKLDNAVKRRLLDPA
jgi:hypothetical protein